MVEDFKTSLYLKKEEKDFLDRNSISLTKFVRNQMKPLLRKNENALSLESGSIFNHVTSKDDYND